MRFIAGNYNGKQQLAVQTDSDDSKLNNPYAYLANFKFHSDFSLFRYIAQATFSVSFPAYTAQTVTVNDKKNSSTAYKPVSHSSSVNYNLGTSVSSTDFVIASVQNQDAPIASSTIVQRNNTSFRRLNLSLSGTTITVEEDTLTYRDNLPSYAETLNAYVFAVANSAGSDPGVLLRAELGRVTFGQGKLDSEVPYLTEVVASSLSLLNSGVLTKDRTLNHSLYRYSYTSDWGVTQSGFDWDANNRHVGMAYRFGTLEEKIGTVDYPPAPALYRIKAV